MQFCLLLVISALWTCHAKSGIRHNRHLGLRGTARGAVSGRNGDSFELEGATLHLKPDGVLTLSLDGPEWDELKHISIASTTDNRWEIRASVAGSEAATAGGKRILLHEDDTIGDLLAFLAESVHPVQPSDGSDELIESIESIREFALLGPLGGDNAAVRFIALLRDAAVTVDAGSQPEQVASFARLVDDIARTCNVATAAMLNEDYMGRLRSICATATTAEDMPPIPSDGTPMRGTDFFRVLASEPYQACVTRALAEARIGRDGDRMFQAFRTIGAELLPKIVDTFRDLADPPAGGSHAGAGIPPAASGAGTGGPGAGSGAAGVTVLETDIFGMLQGHYAAVDGEGPDPGAAGSAHAVMELSAGGVGAGVGKGRKKPPAVQALVDLAETVEGYSADVTTRDETAPEVFEFMTAELRLSRRGNLALAMWAVDEEQEPPVVACLRSRLPDPALPEGALDCMGLLHAAIEANYVEDGDYSMLVGLEAVPPSAGHPFWRHTSKRDPLIEALLDALEVPRDQLPAARDLTRDPAVYAMGLVLHSLVEMNDPGRLAGAHSIVSALPDHIYAGVINAGEQFGTHWQSSLRVAFPLEGDGQRIVQGIGTVPQLLGALIREDTEEDHLRNFFDGIRARDASKLAGLAAELLNLLLRSAK